MIAARPPLPDDPDAALRLRDEFLVATGMFDAFNDWLRERESKMFGTPMVAFQNRYQSPLYNQEGGDPPRPAQESASCEPAPGSTEQPGATSARQPLCHICTDIHGCARDKRCRVYGYILKATPGHTPAGGEDCETCGGTGGDGFGGSCPNCGRFFNEHRLPAESAQTDDITPETVASIQARADRYRAEPAREAALSRLAETDAALIDPLTDEERARNEVDHPDWVKYRAQIEQWAREIDNDATASQVGPSANDLRALSLVVGGLLMQLDDARTALTPAPDGDEVERPLGWVNVYPQMYLGVPTGKVKLYTATLYATREEADKHQCAGRIGCFPIGLSTALSAKETKG